MHKVHRIGTLLVLLAPGLMAGCDGRRIPLVSSSQHVQLADATAERARQRFIDYGCVACHTIPGVKAPVTVVGPPLENLALRGYIGGVLPNTPDNLVKWLQDPPAVDPRTAMPDMGVSSQDAKAMAAYLLRLD
ncbi:c-type cytochrome [Alcaligenaceae bacterium]|nr:c-type cytochrome [Alcaligenaceae bacterium]